MNLEVMAGSGCRSSRTVIGEGGSGGALAIGVGNRVLMMENSIYSVISPEACSSILYRDATKAEKAADALKLTAKDLLGLKVDRRAGPRARGRRAPRPGPGRPSPSAASLRKHLQRARRSWTPRRAGRGPLPEVPRDGRLLRTLRR